MLKNYVSCEVNDVHKKTMHHVLPSYKPSLPIKVDILYHYFLKGHHTFHTSFGIRLTAIDALFEVKLASLYLLSILHIFSTA